MSKRGPLIALLLLLIGLAIVAWLWLLPGRAGESRSRARTAPRAESNPRPAAGPGGAASKLPAGANPNLARRLKPDESGAKDTSGDFQVRGFVTNTQGAALTGAKISLAETCGSGAALVSASTDSIGFYQVRFDNSADGLAQACLRVERAGYNPASEWIQPQAGWQKKDVSLTAASASLPGSPPGARARPSNVGLAFQGLQVEARLSRHFRVFRSPPVGG